MEKPNDDNADWDIYADSNSSLCVYWIEAGSGISYAVLVFDYAFSWNCICFSKRLQTDQAILFKRFGPGDRRAEVF